MSVKALESQTRESRLNVASSIGIQVTNVGQSSHAGKGRKRWEGPGNEADLHSHKVASTLKLPVHAFLCDPDAPAVWLYIHP